MFEDFRYIYKDSQIIAPENIKEKTHRRNTTLDGIFLLNCEFVYESG